MILCAFLYICGGLFALRVVEIDKKRGVRWKTWETLTVTAFWPLFEAYLIWQELRQSKS